MLARAECKNLGQESIYKKVVMCDYCLKWPRTNNKICRLPSKVLTCQAVMVIAELSAIVQCRLGLQ